MYIWNTAAEASSRIYSDYMAHRTEMAQYKKEQKEREQAEANLKLNVTAIKEAAELSKLTGQTVNPTDLYKKNW